MTANLLDHLDPAHPGLVGPGERLSEEAAAAILSEPRPYRFRFDADRKPEVLAFLNEAYPEWGKTAVSRAKTLTSMSVADAQKPRGLSAIAELGKAWWATGDPAYGADFERFYTSVPTGEMFSWGDFNGSQGSIELGAFFLLQDCEGFSREGRVAFLRHLFALADDAWDERTSRWKKIGLGPEGHNWYLHGIHMHPFVGLLFPELKRAGFFLSTSMSMVEDHVRGHYRPDGGARETTLGYQAGSMRVLWDIFTVTTRNGYPLSEGFAERLLHATRFILDLATPNGALPSFGDTHPEPGSLAGLAAIAAACTGDGACKWYGETFRKFADPDDTVQGLLPCELIWQVGLDGAETYASAKPLDPTTGSVLMGQTGYAALRDKASTPSRYLAVAAANRGPIVTSHGHNDIFSLDVHADGTRFIGEMGCAPYGTSPGRAYDESTTAHSCLTVDGAEQVPIVNEWRWDGCVMPCVRRWITAETHDFFHGVHEGFYRFPDHQVLHARKIFFVKADPSYWIVLDWIESNVDVQTAVYWHGCVPGRIDGTAVRLEADRTSLAVIPAHCHARPPRQEQSDGLAAYIREKELEPDSVPCFIFENRSGSTCLAWVLAPVETGATLPRVGPLDVTLNGEAASPAAATALAVEWQTCRDVLCVTHCDYDATLEVENESAFGHLVFRRLFNDGRDTIAHVHTMDEGSCGR